jgi:hypothetical protein
VDAEVGVAATNDPGRREEEGEEIHFGDNVDAEVGVAVKNDPGRREEEGQEIHFGDNVDAEVGGAAKNDPGSREEEGEEKDFGDNMDAEVGVAAMNNPDRKEEEGLEIDFGDNVDAKVGDAAKNNPGRVCIFRVHECPTKGQSTDSPDILRGLTSVGEIWSCRSSPRCWSRFGRRSKTRSVCRLSSKAYIKGHPWTALRIARAHHALTSYALRATTPKKRSYGRYKGGHPLGRLPMAIFLPLWIPYDISPCL